MNTNQTSKLIQINESTASPNRYWKQPSTTADFTPSRVNFYGETWLLLGSYGARMVPKGQDIDTRSD